MSNTARAPAGDKVTVSVLVAVEPAAAFAVFTEEIDLWWRRGPAYRVGGRNPGVLAFEPAVGGRLFERLAAPDGERVIEVGRVTVWVSPSRLGFEWRGRDFAAGERTYVAVRFEASPSGTLVTVEHSGWAALRGDHPVRHGLEVPAFSRMLGMWWGDLMTGLREHVAERP